MPRTFFRSLFIYVWTLLPIFPTPALLLDDLLFLRFEKMMMVVSFMKIEKKKMPEVLFLGTNPKVVLVADNTFFSSFCYIKN